MYARWLTRGSAARDALQVVDVITGEEYDLEYAHVIGEGNDGT